MRRSLALLAVAALSAALVPAGSSTAASDGREMLLRFNGSGSTLDLSNAGISDLAVRISSAGGSIVPATGRGNGYSARTPRYDANRDASPAVIVVTSRSGDPLSPGTRSFTFGAHFVLDSASQGSSTDNGNNLIQRGLYSGKQYKLQVDNRRVLCRVSGSSGAVGVQASMTVDSSSWYRAVCTRDGDRVTLELTRYGDGSATVRSWSARGAIGGLSYGSSVPLSIGGKVNDNGNVISYDSDQFNGRIDNPFFRLL